MKSNTPHISKTLYIKGLQCHKSLFLYKYHPELKEEQSRDQIFQSGIEAGLVARQLFPAGVEMPYDGLTISNQIDLTKSEISKGTQILYEAAFSHNGIFVKSDILHRGTGGWEIYEVKSSTGLKDVYIDDVAIQYHVLKGTGLSVLKVSIVHINNKYVRNGEIEIDKLFTIIDVTDAVKDKQGFTIEEIERQKEVLTGDMPEIDIGKYCTEPYDCDFQRHCWKHIPENSIFDLKGRGINKFDFYKRGIIQIKDVSFETLNYHQGIQARAAIGKETIMDRDRIKEFLDSLWFPLYFLDFETFDNAIPPFNGTSPYQKIPFQYSLHYLKNKDAETGHYEFLASPGNDPRKEIIDRLLREIPEDACVLTYNKSFEIGRLNDFSEWFPEYREKIETIISNIRDLAEPFRRKDYYHWQMKGSYSIKAVLPVLVPDLTYKGMEIGDGGMAMEAYSEMGRSDDPREIEKIRRALLEYCRLDTLGMVRILEAIKKINMTDFLK